MGKLHVLRMSMVTAVAVAILTVVSAGQTPELKKYAKGGVTFEYIQGWELIEGTGQDAQRVALSNKETDSQILITVLRKRVESKEPMADLKKQVVDPWLTTLISQYTKAGINVERLTVNAEVGGQQAEGAKLKFSLDGQAGGAEAYWVLLDKRLVLLYFIRPDKMAEKAAIGWDTIRKTIRAASAEK